MSSSIYIFKMIFIICSVMFLLVSSHFLMSLLFLELMSMMIYFSILFMIKGSTGTLILIYLCMMVLEGVFGLSLVISSSRKVGGDFLISF